MIDLPLSQNQYRNRLYLQILSNQVSLKRLINLGNHLMKKEKLHRHFFFKPTFLERLYGTTYMLPTASYLAYYALNLPFEKNKEIDKKIISKSDAIKIIILFEKRITERCPVEYITHECWYLNRKFYINQHVLVPRSLMNTRFTDFLSEMKWENFSVLDLCTGSGCIGITLALLHSTLKVDLADISVEALKVAKINIDNYQLQNRVKCIQSDLFDNIHQKYDLIISNPPYVASKVVNKGPPELKSEPRIALDGGVDGLEIIDKILKKAHPYLNKQGKLICEVGFDAPKLIKKRYPHIFKWYTPKPLKGEESWFDFFLYSGHCIFQSDAKDLARLGTEHEY